MKKVEGGGGAGREKEGVHMQNYSCSLERYF